MFQHKPLSPGRNIRTLMLEPHQDLEAPINIALREICLPDNKKTPCGYEALSYVWGARTGDQPIQCEGQELLVTKSCLEALRHLRLKKTSRTLWVDAICIDQTSDDEKTHQVKMMGDVYAQASEVIVWFGYGDRKIEHLMRRFSRLSFIGERGSNKSAQTSSPKKILLALAIRGSDRASPAHSSLKYHEWFNRAWTLQEACYARTIIVLYGTHSVPWNTFISCLWAGDGVAQLYQYSAYSSTHFARTIFQMWSRSGQKDGREACIAIFEITYSRRSSIAHDHVYAYYQILSDLGIQFPNPDYNTLLPALYQMVTLIIIKSKGRLDILQKVSSRNRQPGLHSWVPDFSQSFDSTWINPHQISSPYLQNLPFHPAYLHLQGRTLDKVLSISESTRTDSLDPSIPLLKVALKERCTQVIIDLLPFLATIDNPETTLFSDSLSLTEFNNQTLPFNPHPDSSLDQEVSIDRTTTLRALAFGILISGLSPTSFSPGAIMAQKLWKYYVKAILNLVYIMRELNTEHLHHPIEDLIQWYLNTSQGIREGTARIPLIQGIVATCQQGVSPFVTEKGLVGLAYGNVVVGDLVVVLPFCDSPMVLRGVDGRVGQYTVVGRAGVVGVPGRTFEEVDRLEGVEDVVLV